MPEISVIIPTNQLARNHHGPVLLEKCLSSFLTQDLEKNLFEIIVVDNPGCKETAELVGSYADKHIMIKYIVSHPPGANRARNRGLDLVQSEIVLFLDDDCELPEPYFLKKIVRYHQEFSLVSGFGGEYRSSHGANMISICYNNMVNVWLHLSKFRQNRTSRLAGGNMSFKRSVFRDKAFFDNELVYGGTETELLQRLYDQGHIFLLLSDLAVIHNVTGGWRKVFLSACCQGLTKANLLYRKIYGPKGGLWPYTHHRLRSPHPVYSVLFDLFYYLTMCFSCYGRLAFLKIMQQKGASQ